MAFIQGRADKNGNTKYRVQIRLKGAPTLSATFSRKTDAKRWAQQEETKIREGRHFRGVEAKRHTVTDLIDRYKTTVLPQKPKSIAKQSAQLDWWKNQLGYLLLSDLTPARIAEARDVLATEIVTRPRKKPITKESPQIEKVRGPATVKRYLAVLSHACTIAVKEWAWIEMNPVQNVTKPKEPRGRVRYLSDDERESLLKACKASSNEYLYLIVVIALSTGMRKSEIINLKWSQVDVKKERIILTETKNDERRAVPLSGHALDLIKSHAKVRSLNTDYLFPARKPRGKSDVPIDIRVPWLAVLKKAKIEDFHFHDLRHSTASYLAMNGASLAEIAEILGHKTLQMVKRYAHLSESHTSKVVAKMNKQIFS